MAGQIIGVVQTKINEMVDMDPENFAILRVGSHGVIPDAWGDIVITVFSQGSGITHLKAHAGIGPTSIQGDKVFDLDSTRSPVIVLESSRFAQADGSFHVEALGGDADVMVIRTPTGS